MKSPASARLPELFQLARRLHSQGRMIASRSCLVAVVALAVTHTAQAEEACPSAEKVASALADLAMAIDQADRSQEAAQRIGAARSLAGRLQSAAKECRYAQQRAELAGLRKSDPDLADQEQESPEQEQEADVRTPESAMGEEPFVIPLTLTVEEWASASWTGIAPSTGADEPEVSASSDAADPGPAADQSAEPVACENRMSGALATLQSEDTMARCSIEGDCPRAFELQPPTAMPLSDNDRTCQR